MLGKTIAAMDAHFNNEPDLGDFLAADQAGISQPQQAISSMNEWWQINQKTFQSGVNNELSNQQIGLLFQLIHKIMGLGLNSQEIVQACQDATNLIKIHNPQLVQEIQTVLLCILYIDQEIVPLAHQAHSQWVAPLKKLQQTIKIELHQSKLKEAQQKKVIQILRSVYQRNEPMYNEIRRVFAEISDEFVQKKTQPIERVKLTNHQQPLENKEADLQWNAIFRNEEDDEETQLHKANDLIASCYISLDMQDAVLSLFDKVVIINTRTGKIAGLPDVEAIINKSAELSTIPINKNKIVRALDAAYQAVQIAIFIASTEQLYSQAYYFFKPQNNSRFIAVLKNKKVNLEKIVAQTNPNWSQYVWQSLTTNRAFAITNHETLPTTTPMIDQPILQADDLVLTKNDIQRLLNNTNVNNAHDYKKLGYSALQQANLLFEQCFIAQQHHIYFPEFADLHITPPTYRPARSITIPLIIKYAQELENRDLPILHQLLLDTRLAIQTALDIATRNSTYIGSSLLNPIYIRDPLVMQLQSYDADIATLLADPNYGDLSYYDTFYNPLRDYITLGLIKGTYFAGAALAAYVTIYAAYQHGGTVLTTAYIPFHATTQVMSWLLSTIKNLTGGVVNLTNKAVDTAVQPLASLNELVYGPKNSLELKSNGQKNIRTTKNLEKTLPSPQDTKRILENIQDAIDPQIQKNNSDIDSPFHSFLPAPEKSTTDQANSYFDRFKEFVGQLPAPQQPSSTKTQEQALWDATATGTYDLDYNATNKTTNRNIATGLTPQENKDFAPYAAGALAAGTAGLGGAVALNSAVGSIATAAGQGAAQGVTQFAIATTPVIAPATSTATATATGTASGLFGTGLTAGQLATGATATTGIIGAAATGNSVINNPSKTQQTSPKNPPTGPNYYSSKK